MSSVISTKAGHAQARTVDTPVGGRNPNTPATPAGRAGILPWQFFVLAALGCATAVNVMVRGQGIVTIVLLTILVGSTALVGIAALRTLNPLVTEADDRTAVIGGRTRAALEREKVLALRAIKELEFDRAMGKVSEPDFEEMAGRLRARAARLMRQLDAGAGYRDRIERDLAKRLEHSDGSAKALDRRSAEREGGSAERDRSAKALPERNGSAKASAERVSAQICACGTTNDVDAKFCKGCGARL